MERLRKIPCGFCGAKAGQPCTKPSPQWDRPLARSPIGTHHTARWEKLYDVQPPK